MSYTSGSDVDSARVNICEGRFGDERSGNEVFVDSITESTLDMFFDRNLDIFFRGVPQLKTVELVDEPSENRYRNPRYEEMVVDLIAVGSPPESSHGVVAGYEVMKDSASALEKLNRWEERTEKALEVVGADDYGVTGKPVENHAIMEDYSSPDRYPDGVYMSKEDRGEVRNADELLEFFDILFGGSADVKDNSQINWVEDYL
ncbi:MAG: hypothetical protein ABEJ83_00195 [Candidatus Nanohaloarchaea archaeon]